MISGSDSDSDSDSDEDEVSAEDDRGDDDSDEPPPLISSSDSDDNEVNAEDDEPDEDMDNDDSDEEDMPWKMQRTPDEPQDPSDRIRVTPLVAPPSAQEWLRHQALHVPYARWCKLCVKTRGTDRRRGRVKPEKLGETPIVVLDFSFVKMKEQEKARPILVG